MLHRIAQALGRRTSTLSSRFHPPPAIHRDFADPSLSSSFLLDESGPFVVNPEVKLSHHPQWMYPTHLREPRYSLVLAAGESLETRALQVYSDSVIYLRFAAALPQISEDGLVCEISFVNDVGQSRSSVGTFSVLGGKSSTEWRVVELDVAFLAGLSGRLLIECGPGPQDDATADWLALADVCVARECDLKALLARTHHALRIKNEIAHFSAAYRNDMYSKVQDKQSEASKGGARDVRQLAALPCGGRLADVDLHIEPPFEDEVAYAYATRLLRANVPQTPPDFEARLREKVRTHGSIKVLSICSGAARIEAGMALAVPEGIEWSLLDINEDLLQMAARQFTPGTKLDLIVADANDLAPTGEQWDVIICISALHHLVELEKVMLFISSSLKVDGEFWSIGEAVGRNGNRLWPEAIVAANEVFSALPAQYRFNANTKVTDAVIPDRDHSIGCFEGIRSEELCGLLDSWLEPVELYRQNCFLWRMIDLAYSNNFDLKLAEDQERVVAMVKAEVIHYRSGGRGTELFGVYKRRHL
ncbi:class I SAM-dependent methyltransferase [Pseudomonas sp. 91RF]|uniref:class I SAM-dependent methyltransferase n=1 Tax=Pseudomonas sp. 91RF TaxID=2292261 RepID=UPI000E667411|nr:class I SAM-dependent methyltransferase [Pseudomonas sp. 91RF]RIJ09405.1 class I SAM-dependent methyltransferase [Pseudomonas sp. 91RF]